MTSEIDPYAWDRCTHEGIGQPGCPTCDPDKHRVAARYERRIETLRGELATAKQSVETLQAVASTCAEQAKADHDRAEKVERERDALRARVRTLEGALGISEPWPVADMLDNLGTAALHLVKDHGCDGHGWEEVTGNIARVRVAALKIRAALSGAQPASALPVDDDAEARITKLIAEKNANAKRTKARLSGAQPDTALAERDRYRAALEKVSAIRDSIIGAQTFNWSEHAYPLVAVLGEVGFPGVGHEIASANLGTLIERANASDRALAEREASIVELRRALEDALPFLSDHAEDVKDLAASWPENPDGIGAAKTAQARVEIARAALAQPAPQAALRAMLVTAANVGHQDGEAHSLRSPTEVADAVLKGES